ncbi:MAG TPA: LytTR family DNA-binding domain-containing protein [Dinghuibacter sp.]|jgi:DNA-binding LytR/AlgR family response regulator|uniref:LytR/AlgR family response regulator transcription factor n=1 Tax=Dinghuibacter sp. TaxID=2024697 RepID=UPI002C94E917|nr:LytTR family DNA-binding domain-containing protein [Dinghuibacter sp.]HTJ10473.1 LytTR family DNA-binding domain-containing protein [Dinghuibacter sp.]
MTVLIIEDERKAAVELQTLVLRLQPEWRVCDIIPSAAEAIEWLVRHPMPDLIFSDIQLADADCFRIFESVDVTCPVIFCTAYDEYAIKAFETGSIDYLLKPLDKNKLEKALAKLDRMRSMFTRPPYEELGRLIGHHALLVHHRDKITPIRYTDVVFFHYAQGVVRVCLQDGESHYVTQLMDDIESKAGKRQFFRANRQFLINRDAIADIEKFFARKLVIKMSRETPEPVIISKARASEFLLWLQTGA